MILHKRDGRPDVELLPGIAGRNVAGDRAMVCRFTYAPNTSEPVHSHESEQFCYIVTGRVEFVSHDRKFEAGPGDIVHLPSNVPHGINIFAEGAEMIEIFSPLRPDLIARFNTSVDANKE